MISFFGCGFARVVVKHSFVKPTGKVEYDHDNRLRNYLAVFQGHQERYEVDKQSFVKRSKSLVHHFGKWKLKTNKDKYTEHFSPNNWEKLTEYEKKQHTRSNCEACDVHHFSFQSLFPLWNQKENSITQQGFHKNINSHILKPSCSGNVKVTKKAIKTATCTYEKQIEQIEQIYEKINTPFKKIFGVTFAKAQTTVSELGLEDKKSHAEKKKERRKNPQLTRVASRRNGQKRTATPCFPPDRPTASDRSNDCHFSLKVQKMQNRGPIKEATGRRRPTKEKALSKARRWAPGKSQCNERWRKG